MNTLNIFALFVVVCSFAGCKVCGAVNNSYFITAPSVFRPGLPFKLLIKFSDVVTSPVNIEARIFDFSSKQTVSSGTGTFTNGPPTELTLQIPHGVAVQLGGYKLRILGTGGAEINQTKDVRFEQKGFSIYIQTDKAVYKPGQKVLMRIFGVHPDLKLYTGNVTVDILDPNNNKMAHWVNLNSNSGVIKREFLLSTEPVEGNWKISVTAEDQTAEQVIEIKPYVLPKFEVKVNLDPYVLKGATKLRGSVDVKYTYGKGAKGVANIRAYFNYYWYDSMKVYSLSTDAKVEANGQGNFSFAMRDVYTLFKESFRYVENADLLFVYNYRLEINVTFHEELTNKVASGQGSVNFYKSDVMLKFAEFNPKYYKPGLSYTALLRVTKPDGELLSQKRLAQLQSRIKLTTRYTWRTEQPEFEYASPLEDGTIIITRNIPSSASWLELEAEYSELLQYPVTATLSASRSQSPSDSYIQLSTTTPSVKAGDNIECKVQATYSMTELKYMMLARGVTVKTGTYTSPSASTQLSFTLPSTPAMAPTARLIVYSIKQGGEIVVDTLNIKVENPFQNKVSLSIDTNNRATVAPGDTVTIKGSASADSLMAFRAIDKSVLLMKEDTDISVSKVLEELQSFDSADTWYPIWEWGFRRRRMIMPYPTAGRDAASIFLNSGVVVFTNYNLPGGWDSRGVIMFAAESGGADVAEDVASKSGSATPKLAEVKRVRSLFPETWIWMEKNVSSSGVVEFQQSIPDTLTTWVVSAFAVSPSDGLGVGEVKPQVQVFQSFFVSLNLPYSVIRGEEVAIQVTVFSYETMPQLVTITLKSSKDWAVITEKKSGQRGVSIETETEVDVAFQLSVDPGQGKAVSFPVIPKTLGDVPIEVTAQSESRADAVRRTLLVEPEGIPQEYSYSLLLDLNSTSYVSHTLQLSLPDDTVDGSARATLSVMGDILGSSFSNLDHLVRMPYGCGEQNMVNFAPNIYVMKYLTTVNQLTQKIENKAKSYMISGYQREQTYRHNDGSYSAFGGRDTSGSLWLTAFVAKSFSQAREFIPEYIDDALLATSLEWMARQTNADGSFRNVGSTAPYLKGGQTGEISLTAYILIALAEANSQSRNVLNAKNKATAFLENEVEKMSAQSTDSYTLAITAYALSLVGSGKTSTALNKLQSKATDKDGMKFWTEKSDNDNAWDNPYYRPPSADIEITAYALLAFTKSRDFNFLLPILRWLSRQRNSFGGYASTQDTVVGLQALSEFAAMIYSPNVDFNVQVTSTSDPGFTKNFVVNSQNAVVLQQAELLKLGGSLRITASGRGFGMVQMGVTYNAEKEPGERSFDFDLSVLEESKYMLKLRSCARWAVDDGLSGMAVMDVTIPSGFELDPESVEKSLSDSSLKLKRADATERKVLLYFDEIPSDRMVCVTMVFNQAYSVGKPQPSPAVVYDYYRPENRATALYVADSLKDSGVCRVCSDCVNCVYVEPTVSPGKSDSLAPGLSATIGSGTLVVLFLLLSALLQ